VASTISLFFIRCVYAQSKQESAEVTPLCEETHTGRPEPGYGWESSHEELCRYYDKITDSNPDRSFPQRLWPVAHMRAAKRRLRGISRKVASHPRDAIEIWGDGEQLAPSCTWMTVWRECYG